MKIVRLQQLILAIAFLLWEQSTVRYVIEEAYGNRLSVQQKDLQQIAAFMYSVNHPSHTFSYAFHVLWSLNLTHLCPKP